MGIETVAIGAALGGGALAASSSGKKSTGSTTTSSAPWQPQQQPIQYGLDQARGIYDQAMANGAYTGPTYAGMNSGQQSAADYLQNFNAGTGRDLAYGTAGTSQALQGASSQYLNSAGQLAAGGLYSPNSAYSGLLQQYASGGTPLSSYGVSQGTLDGMTSAGTSAIGGLSQGQSVANTVAQQALQDPTQQIASNANSYINNDVINGQIDAVNRDISRTLSEQTLPGLNQQATAGGNLNSSRAGMAEAVATRAAQDRMADNAATIRSNAYNTALSTSANQYNQGLSTALGASSALTSSAGVGAGLLSSANGTAENARQFDTTSRLGAATSGLSSDLGYAGLDQSGRIAGTNALGTATGLGISGAAQASNLGQQAGQGQYQGGLYYQQDQQGQYDAAKAAQTAQTDYGWQQLQNYMSLVGQNYGGGSSTQAGTTPGTNGLQSFLGGANSGLGMVSGMNSMGLFGSSGGTGTANLPQANYYRAPIT